MHGLLGTLLIVPLLAGTLLIVPLLAGILMSMPTYAQTRATDGLDIYVIDVEGGEATLFVFPSGESLLIDTGWPGFGGRDADRIAAVARQAGIKQIDQLVITHFHSDHAGGTAQLARLLPIRRFVDHGSTVDKDDRGQTLFQSYTDVRRNGIHNVATPGDIIPISGVEVRIIA